MIRTRVQKIVRLFSRRPFHEPRWSRMGLILALLVAMACATSPTGRKQLTLFPDSQMNQMGATAFSEMQKQTPIETDPKYNAYVTCVATAILREASDPTGVGQWEIKVFRDDSANAFALPGGKIGVHTGLFKVAKTPGQLAAVLGHEVAHVTARHGNERVTQAFGTQLTLAGINEILTRRGNENRATLMALLGVGAQLGVALPHGRTQESEADVVGLEYMAKAGFDPRESVELWKNMGAASGGKQPPQWLSTHPSHENRIANLQSRFGEMIPIYEQARRAGKNPNCKL